MVLSSADLVQRVNEYKWFHSIDLGSVVTRGKKTPEVLNPESEAIFAGVDLRGKTVMDIGAWNGYYTVEFFRRGASDVLAIDSPTWTRPDLRGKETFDLVMSQLSLTPKSQILDVQEISEEQVGKWDVVLMLGVLYHLIDPIIALRRLAPCVKEVLVIEMI